MKSYSGNGEDRILVNLLEHYNFVGPGTFVDVGAGHPENKSNSKLFIDRGWRALLVEANEERAQALAKYHRPNHDVGVVQLRVGTEYGHRYDQFAKLCFGHRPAVLSIDIDGNDFWVWGANTDVQPQFVIAEYNPDYEGECVAMPYDYDHEWDGTDYYGASFQAMVKLGGRIGYMPVARTRANIIFVSASTAAFGTLTSIADKPFEQPRLHPRSERRLQPV